MHSLPWLLLIMGSFGWAADHPCTYIKGITGLNFFESLHPSGRWIVMNCARGSAYNAQTCSCSDFVFGCKLYATSSGNKFAYFDNGVLHYKTCSDGTVYKPEYCGCFEPTVSAIVQ